MRDAENAFVATMAARDLEAFADGSLKVVFDKGCEACDCSAKQ